MRLAGGDGTAQRQLQRGVTRRVADSIGYDEHWHSEVSFVKAAGGEAGEHGEERG